MAFSCLGFLTGCSAAGEKSGSLSIIYGVAALLSLLLLLGCIKIVRKNRGWFLTLFSSVLVVNIGYTLLSVFTCLEEGKLSPEQLERERAQFRGIDRHVLDFVLQEDAS